MSSLDSKCLMIEIRPGIKYDIADIRERHSDGCKGDPSTEPRLFSLRVDRKTGIVMSDAQSIDGTFHRIK
jgi:hypothetical protein